MATARLILADVGSAVFERSHTRALVNQSLRITVGWFLLLYVIPVFHHLVLLEGAEERSEAPGL
jgi:hypothetical protein